MTQCPNDPVTRLPSYYFSPLPYAVGSKGFVEHVKSALGALAKGRKAKESGDSYQLREPSAPYGEHFGVKNGDIGLKNTYFGNFNPK